jgi:hypothetical protein
MQVIRPDNTVTDRAAKKTVRADIVVTQTAALVNMLPAERLFANAAGYRMFRTEPGGADRTPGTTGFCTCLCTGFTGRDQSGFRFGFPCRHLNGDLRQEIVCYL